MASLLILLDDIVTVLDDVASMSKVAAKKTAGILGDDLALNAQQVSGVKADREIPVVWAVAKGSLLNKAIILPIALLLSTFLPIAINILLLIGGVYLCFEGFEKIAHSLFSADKAHQKQQRLQANADQNIDLLAVEQKKIKGAIRTDFILSAEIIIIALASIPSDDLVAQVLTLTALSIGLTGFVYGFVAAIVKMDDLGLYLMNQSKDNTKSMLPLVGKSLIAFAPILMKLLVFVGTVAMFLVGGGLIEHNLSFLAEWVHNITALFTNTPDLIASILPSLLTGIVGLVAGGLCFLVVTLIGKLSKKT
ncbi:DUF808 domain-containing protein [Psychromonas sp. 14N.309.X.WAT.B.A12]|uniref:DUF808 domain-containing protein n=1 Tax=unclassified Psychromonas TaxID=2614957 RepID=UPI0025B04702|nr:DUF808 domain-containing protein [Psychromonas sp. 14N.309.X.WAT.B.A12]MDN2662506.1 DUF808 domain-containing protein [Psychromonas sp. 14N.309.X.WAT.B.A12]